MKFYFSKNLDYQQEAIKSVVDIFDTGKNTLAPTQPPQFVLNMIGATVQNALEIDEGRILLNLKSIQRRNGIESVDFLESHDFSVEMETGTGKTYVYLRTIMELAQKYLLKKFIILVPSVAIREGVLKTIEQTQEHFRELYGNGFGYFVYDSSKLHQVREFAQSLDIQIMIMTIQSFNSDTRVLRQTDRDDAYFENSYLQYISKTQPVVIMDEPQNMGSELAKASINDLNPLFKLRYSATHREIHNLVYRLTPVDAYRKNLVKRIEVCGIKEYDQNELFVKVKEIKTQRGKMPQATVLLDVQSVGGSFKLKEVVLRAGDSLAKKSNNAAYGDRFVNDVNAQFNRVELSDGKFHSLEDQMQNKVMVFRTQIRETIKAHMSKQEQIGKRAKVLSLFFIDRVDNYVGSESLLKTIFIEEFNKLKGNYEEYRNTDPTTVHKGYFASKKVKGQTVFQDTRGDSAIDKEAYDLIMKEKERLLSLDEPVSFIFSHSALKEGWDNPNIFQICTLRETRSAITKRQEIGRGLRLAVDTEGQRIYEKELNVLTVIANESYEEYVGSLQREFTDSGYGEVPETQNAREQRVAVKVHQKNICSEDFKVLWNKINKRTRFNLDIQTAKLVTVCVDKINELTVSNIVISVERVYVEFDGKGKVSTSFSAHGAGGRGDTRIRIGNFVDRIANETNLTRATVVEILTKAKNLSLLFENPEEYIRAVAMIIKGVLHDLLFNEGLRYVPTGEVWEVDLLFKETEALLSRVLPSQHSVFDHVIWDSEGEKRFADRLEHNPRVQVYTKLPRNFRIPTPLGDYIPDWAIVWKTEDGDKLYLVRETKFDYSNLSTEATDDELKKFLCGKKHFAAIGFDNFALAQKEDLSDLL